MTFLLGWHTCIFSSFPGELKEKAEKKALRRKSDQDAKRIELVAICAGSPSPSEEAGDNGLDRTRTSPSRRDNRYASSIAQEWLHL